MTQQVARRASVRGRVQGVTFWRADAGGYVEDGRLLFEGVEYRGADELIRYRFRPCHGEPSRIAYRVRLERSVTDRVARERGVELKPAVRWAGRYRGGS